MFHTPQQVWLTGSCRCQADALEHVLPATSCLYHRVHDHEANLSAHSAVQASVREMRAATVELTDGKGLELVRKWH